MLQHCPYCSANHIGGLEGCQAIFYQVVLNADMPLTSGMGRGIFDTYCLQHPELYCKSAKSYAAHLALLYCWIAYPNNQEVLEAIRRGLNGPFRAEKAFLPEVGKRGTLTILHLKRSQSTNDIETRATQWIDNVWSAYAEVHTQAKDYWQVFMDRH